MRYIKLVEIPSLGVGETRRVVATFEEAGTIKYMLAVEKDGKSLNAIMLTMTLDGRTFTRDSIPASALGMKENEAMSLGLTVNPGSKLDISAENRSTATVTLYLLIYVD